MTALQPERLDLQPLLSVVRGEACSDQACLPLDRNVIQLFTAIPGGPLRWRLLASNHRELGRGAQAFDDVLIAQIVLDDLRTRLDCSALDVRGSFREGWAWDLRADELRIASSVRTYARESRALDAGEQFLHRFRTAPVAHAITVTNVRRWQPRDPQPVVAPGQ
jgi:hypothetical protein